jgi:hypothetical protein
VSVEVVGAQVEEQADFGRELERVLGLEARHLAHHRGLGFELAHQRGERGPHVARHGHRQSCLAPDGAEQLGGGGLAVGAGHGHEALRQEPPRDLELAQHGQLALARGDDHRRLVRHAGALHDAHGAVEQLHAVRAEMRLHPLGHVRPPGVRADHPAVLREHASDGRPGPGQPDHEIGARGERRPQGPIDCW